MPAPSVKHASEAALKTDGMRILVQSGMLTGGKSLDLMLIPVPETARE